MKNMELLTQETNIEGWSYTQKRNLVNRAFRWCKKNMGVNRRHEFEVIPSIIKGYGEDEDVFGAYCQYENIIYIYHDRVETISDLIGTTIHEYQHSLQPIKTKYHKMALKHGYWNNPLEVEARKVEKKNLPKFLDYLNKVS
jgi:hypothetical protein